MEEHDVPPLAGKAPAPIQFAANNTSPPQLNRQKLHHSVVSQFSRTHRHATTDSLPIINFGKRHYTMSGGRNTIGPSRPKRAGEDLLRAHLASTSEPSSKKP